MPWLFRLELELVFIEHPALFLCRYCTTASKPRKPFLQPIYRKYSLIAHFVNFMFSYSLKVGLIITKWEYV